MMKLEDMVNAVKTFSTENSSRLMIGGAILSLCGSVIFAYDAGMNVNALVRQKKEKMEDLYDRLQNNEIGQEQFESRSKEIKRDFMAQVAKSVTPSVISAGASVFLMLKAQQTNEGIIKGLGVQLAASKMANEKAIESLNLRKKVEEEMLGKSKTQDISEHTTKERAGVIVEPDPNDINVEHIGTGGVLHYDLVMDKYFYAPIGTVDRGIGIITTQITREMFAGINEFYSVIGSRWNPKLGDILGWSVDDLGPNGVPITKTPMLTENGTPVVCLDYEVHICPESCR